MLCSSWKFTGSVVSLFAAFVAIADETKSNQNQGPPANLQTCEEVVPAVPLDRPADLRTKPTEGATIFGAVSVAANGGKPQSDGSLVFTVANADGKPLLAKQIKVKAGSPGPWNYKIVGVPAETNVIVTTKFIGTWNPPAGGLPISAMTGSLRLKPDEVKNVNLVLGRVAKSD